MGGGNVTFYIASSLDGFIATDDGGVSWLDEFQGTNDDGSYEAFFADVDCLVMGSKTYEQILGFGEWPYERKDTYVVTSRGLPTATESVELFDGAVEELAHRLERQYEHIWLVGGAQLAQTFLRLNEIDELRLSVIPVLLGSGIPLFDGNGDRHALALTDANTFDNGIAELRYDFRTQ